MGLNALKKRHSMLTLNMLFKICLFWSQAMQRYKNVENKAIVLTGGFTYSKPKIIKTCLEYIDTEDDEVFVQLLRDLEPMINGIVFRRYSYHRHAADMKQEILFALWRYQRKPDLLKKQPKEFLSQYFYFVIRGYCGKASDKMYRIYEKATNSGGNWMYRETWMGNFENMESE